MNSTSVITRTLFFLSFKYDACFRYLLRWLMTIVYCVGTRLLNAIGMDLLRIRYVVLVGHFI